MKVTKINPVNNGGELVISYHNDLNRSTLGHMSESEQAVFFAICGKMKNCEEEVMLFTFDEVSDWLGHQKLSCDRVYELLEGVSMKLGSLMCYMRNEDNTEMVQMSLFPTFITNKKEGTLRVRTNTDFLYVLNDLNKNFTSFRFVNLLEVKGKYVKSLFRLLKQFESTGFLTMSLDQFRDIMGVPENYDNTKMKSRIVNPSIKQLSKHFPNLSFKMDSRGKGKALTHISFTFDKTFTREEDLEEEMRRILLENS